MALKLRDYQERAVDFLYERDHAMILAPVGAGKTAITLTALDELHKSGHLKRALVLAPKRVCTDVWPVETPKWSRYLRLAVAVGTPKQRTAAFASRTKTGANAVVLNYDNIQWLAKWLEGKPLSALGFNVIVFDELTRLKNPSGQRFKALEKLIVDVPIRWGLTGSFTSNGLEDVFGQCKIVDQSLLGRSKGAFLQKYFVPINREFGEWRPRKNALEQLMAAIKPTTFVLDPGEYADKLPPLYTVEARCDMADLKPYNDMKRRFVLELGRTEITAPSAAAVTNKLQQLSSGFIYDTVRTASERPGKFDVVQTAHWLSAHKFERLDEILEENQHDNTLVFYNFKEELAELRRRYPYLQTLDDPNAIERWNRGEIQLLVAHPKSAQFGLNLQHGGNKVVFMSLPWSLTDYEQAVGRLHRSGQRREVWVYLLIANKTIDEVILQALHDKKSIADIAMEGLR
jgi:SNF2 family DNA or RNA helicase